MVLMKDNTMKRYVGVYLIVIVALSMVFLASCQTQKQKRATLQVQSHKEISVGNYQKALDAYRNAYARNQKDQTLTSDYVQMVEGIRKSADSSFNRKDYKTALHVDTLLLQNFSDFSMFHQLLSFDENYVRERIRDSVVRLTEESAKLSVAEGEYQKALDAYTSVLAMYPEDTEVILSYVGMFESIRNTADKAFEEGDAQARGEFYYFMLENYTRFQNFEVKPSFQREILLAEIAECSTSLNQKALIQYRAGNLDDAISIWKGILTFDPGNKDIRQTMETAAEQLKTLSQ